MKQPILTYNTIPSWDRDLIETAYKYRNLPDISGLSPREYSDFLSDVCEQLRFRDDIFDQKNTSEIAVLIADTYHKINCIEQHLRNARQIEYERQCRENFEEQEAKDYERSLFFQEPPPLNQPRFYWSD